MIRFPNLIYLFQGPWNLTQGMHPVLISPLGTPYYIPAPNRKPASVAASGRYINVDSSEVFLEPKVVDFILPTAPCTSLSNRLHQRGFWGAAVDPAPRHSLFVIFGLYHWYLGIFGASAGIRQGKCSVSRCDCSCISGNSLTLTSLESPLRSLIPSFTSWSLATRLGPRSSLCRAPNLPQLLTS